MHRHLTLWDIFRVGAIRIHLRLPDSFNVILRVKGPVQKKCVKSGKMSKNGWGPAHQGARFEGSDPPEMKF